MTLRSTEATEMMQPEEGADFSHARPRRSVAAATLNAFRSADLLRVLELTQGTSDHRGLLLRARAQLRLTTAEDAVATLDAPYVGATSTDVVQRHLLRSTARTRIGDFEAADEELRAAKAFTSRSAAPVSSAEINLAAAELAFAMGRHHRAALMLSVVFDKASLIDQATDEAYGDVSHLLARTHLLEAHLAGTTQNIDRQMSEYALALDFAIASSTQDPWLTADIAAQYSRSLINYPDPTRLDDLRQKMLSFAWTTSTQDKRFALLHSFGVAAVLSGDRATAFRFYREALVYACTAFDRLVAHCDRAMMTRDLGLRRAELYEEDLELLGELANQISWQGLQRDDQAQLLVLAQLFADVDSDRADAFLKLYDSCKPVDSRGIYDGAAPLNVASHDYSAGLISKYRARERDATLRLFDRAFRAYLFLKCEWRAALAAIEILDIEEHAEAADFARRYSERNPSSWIARLFSQRVVRRRDTPPTITLFPWFN